MKPKMIKKTCAERGQDEIKIGQKFTMPITFIVTEINYYPCGNVNVHLEYKTPYNHSASNVKSKKSDLSYVEMATIVELQDIKRLGWKESKP